MLINQRRNWILVGFTSVLVLVALTILALGWSGSRKDATSPSKISAKASKSTDDLTSEQTRKQMMVIANAKKQSTQASSLPPEKAPLKDVYDSLKARAESGDAEAASRLFKDTRACSRAWQSRDQVSKESGNLDAPVSASSSAEELMGASMDLDRIQSQIDHVKQNSSMCDGLTAEQLNSALPNALLAAKLGDLHAANCYVGANVFLTTDGVLNHPEWLGDYTANAMSLAQRAVANGDWTMVSLLAHSYAGDYRGLWLAQASGTDLEKAYSYYKLWQMGLGASAKDEDRSYLSNKINDLESSLSADQISDADSWASKTYSSSFRDSGQDASGSTNSCSD